MSRDEAPAVGSPSYLFLDPDSPEAIARYAVARGLVAEGAPVTVSRAGDGNMNLTLRLVSGGRSWIVKQARPWVEKYPSIPAPADRALVELAFYQEVASVPELGDRMPRLIGGDASARVLILEDLGDASDFTDLYRGARLSEPALDSLVSFLRRLHALEPADPIRRNAFLNRDMRALNHEHIFRLPLEPDNGLDLDAWTAGLRAAAQALLEDDGYRAKVRSLGERYLEDGPCLVHGDYFPGSWLRTDDGVRIIDPEFCHMGEPRVRSRGAHRPPAPVRPAGVARGVDPRALRSVGRHGGARARARRGRDHAPAAGRRPASARCRSRDQGRASGDVAPTRARVTT